MSTLTDSPPSPPIRVVTALTLTVAIASAVWIVVSFTYPLRAMVYHWPIIVLSCPVSLEIWWRRKTDEGRIWLLINALALTLTAGRYFSDWPFSGHALLGAFWAFAPMPRSYRWMSAAMIPFSYLTKVYLDERSTDALTGAAIGLALFLLAKSLARSR